MTMAIRVLEEFVAEQESRTRLAAFQAWNLLRASDLATPLPPVPWLCEPLGLAPGPVALVAGYGYSRKTMALQSLALSVAAGRSVWGVWSTRPGRVVHLDYEQGRRLTQERYQRLARGMGFEMADIPDEALHVACMPRVYLESQDSLDSLLPVVEGAALVVVDSLRAAFPHADENSSDVRSYLDALNHLSERTGACIAVIHHARKPNAQQGGTATHAIRGSSALFDACQSVYVFEGEKDTATTVHHQKDRVRGTTLEPFGITSEDVTGPSGDRRWGLRVVHLEAEQMAQSQRVKVTEAREAAIARAIQGIEDVFALSGGTFNGTRTEVRSGAGVRAETFDQAWMRLKAEGRLVREGSHRDGIWRLT